ncbi:MAG: hypothetical protein JSU04_12020 [Bdellovibrionales bacterium]|nr:hypothetical protein [Bdellovibrionales bacterium]
MLFQVRTFLMASLLLAFTSPVMASTLHNSESTDQDLIVTNVRETSPASDILQASDPALLDQDFAFTYDPKDFDGETDTSGTKEQLLKSLREEMNTARDQKDLYVPRAPVSAELLEKLSSLSEPELQSFLGKKQKFLERMAKALLFLRLKPKFVNKVLAEVNTKFYNSSRLIANSNSAGVAVMFSVSGGLALPRKIVEKLQTRSLGKFIPKTGGFAYLLGLGVGISRTMKEDGRPHWVLDVFVDTEKLKSTMTGMLEVSAAGTYGVVYELREGHFKTQTTETSYGGVAGVFRQGTNQFGWAASTGMSFPPAIGAILVFTNETKRHYIFRLDFTKFAGDRLETSKAFILSWMQRTGMKTKASALNCSEVF